MDSGTVRYDDDASNTDGAYWRRRAIALGVVVATTGLMAWACSGGDGTAKQKPVTRAAAVTALPSATAAAKPGTGPSPGPTVTVTVTQQTPRRSGDACLPTDVVVDLAPVKPRFAAAETPRFGLSVVNTGKLDCTFDVGAKQLVTKIKSGGDKIWASANCAAGSGSSIQLLRRGIPYASVFDWDRKRSRAACAAPRPKAPPGFYVLQAEGAGIRTKKARFQLLAKKH
jgi:hypothetical protein